MLVLHKSSELSSLIPKNRLKVLLGLSISRAFDNQSPKSDEQKKKTNSVTTIYLVVVEYDHQLQSHLQVDALMVIGEAYTINIILTVFFSQGSQSCLHYFCVCNQKLLKMTVTLGL